MALANLQLSDLQVVDGDEEPRIRDVRLAEMLEQARPRDIRKVIAKNLEELEHFGLARTMTASIESGKGRQSEATEYWLNEAQALIICMRSNAPRAPDCRAEIIKVFMAWRQGRLAPRQQSPDLSTLEQLFDRKLDPVHSRIAGIEGNVIRLTQQHEQDHALVMRRLDDVVPIRTFMKEAQRQFLLVTVKFYDGYCPCCRQVKIVADGVFNAECNFDHYNGRELRTPQDGWSVCKKCNQVRLKNAEYKANRRSHFDVFQECRRMIAGSSPISTKPKRQRFKHHPDQGTLL
jgi:hypothetical protein